VTAAQLCSWTHPRVAASRLLFLPASCSAQIAQNTLIFGLLDSSMSVRNVQLLPNASYARALLNRIAGLINAGNRQHRYLFKKNIAYTVRRWLGGMSIHFGL
jgi:hypothetical protein